MKTKFATMIEMALGTRPRAMESLTGGCVAIVFKVTMPDGTLLVAKVDEGPDAKLAVEADMLRFLAEHTALPVPTVRHASDELLVMDYIEAAGPASARDREAGERQAAEALAGLHGHTAPAYGFATPTLIGPLVQPNPWTDSWPQFYAEHRLLYMGRLCVEAGRMSTAVLQRIERLCERLDDLLGAAAPPGLIHGDVWGGNVLLQGPKLAAFIDPAIYYADPEVELAFIGLFHTFGDAFYNRYAELNPIRDGFFEVRRDIYQLYPLLVHVNLFGGSYLAQVEATLRRF